mmetsp:Transcript_2615/g.6716  ORF Transcript_2615/g.6716 Transcript_2615/m.6716 type:complete len:1079 (+) Transcript_2615:44-3280(+)
MTSHGPLASSKKAPGLVEFADVATHPDLVIFDCDDRAPRNSPAGSLLRIPQAAGLAAFAGVHALVSSRVNSRDSAEGPLGSTNGFNVSAAGSEKNFYDVVAETSEQLRRVSDLVAELVGQHEAEMARLGSKRSPRLSGASQPTLDLVPAPPPPSKPTAHQVSADLPLPSSLSPTGGRNINIIEKSMSPEDASMSLALSVRRMELKIREGFDETFKDQKSHRASAARPNEDRMTAEASRDYLGHTADVHSMPSTALIATLHPDSWLVTGFEAAGLVAIIWDSFALPWYLAMYMVKDDWLWYSSWVPRIFWIMDIILNFAVAYRKKDLRLEDRLDRIALHYLKRWLPFDFALVLLDLAFALVSRGLPEGTRRSRNFPFVVLVVALGARMARQSWRFPVIMEKCRIMRGSVGSLQAFDIGLILWALLALCHVISCIWVLLGDGDSDTGSTWLKALDEDTAGTPSRWYMYFSALHWAFTQMTPGSNEVVPRSTRERAYTVAVLMLGLVIGPTLTATIVSMMTERRLRIQDRTRRFVQLQQYLLQEEVDATLALAINRQVKERLKEPRNIPMTEVKDLTLLSRGMHAELTYAVYGKCLLAHGFFQYLDIFDSQAVVCICSSTIVPVEQVSGDVLFETGHFGDAMFFVRTGILRYYRGFVSSNDLMAGAGTAQGDALDFDGTIIVGPGRWCSEPALWVTWQHLGTMRAGNTSNLLGITAQALQKDLREHTRASFGITCDFSRAFLAFYMGQKSRWSDVDWEIEHSDIFSALRHGARMALAEPILAMLQRRDKASFRLLRRPGQAVGEQPEVPAYIQRLREEISNGTCFISIVQDEVVRTVSVVALRAIRRDTYQSVDAADPFQLLAQIGTIKHGQLKVACVLPGGKRHEQEAPSDAMVRHIEEDLPAFIEVATQQQWDVSQSVSLKESPTYGIRTRYLRTTFEVDIENRELCRLQHIGTPGSTWEPSSIGQDSRSVSDGARTSRKGLWHWIKTACRRRKPEIVETARSLTVATADVHNMAIDILRNKSVAVVSGAKGDATTVYLWLSDSEMELLSDPRVNGILKAFVSDLDVDATDWESCHVDV